MKEIWKDIKNYEGLYQVSNFGRIKSLQREFYNKNQYGINSKRKTREIIKKQCLTQFGYNSIGLSKNGVEQKFQVHRIVAQAFIPNSENKPCVNHINCNKTDNRVENLEWCTYSENEKHAYKNNLHKKHMKGKFGILNPSSKKINQYDLEGNFIKTWNSLSEASKELNFSCANLSSCCLKKYGHKTCGGYKWEFTN